MILSEYFSEDGKRVGTIERTAGSFVIKLFENYTEYRVYEDDRHDINYWEDCCENFVNYWGEFKK